MIQPTVGYFLISIAVGGASWLLFRAAAGSMSLRKLNIVSWAFYLQFFSMTFVAAALTVLGVSHYLIDRVDPIYRVASFWATCYVVLATPLTMAIVQNAFFGGRVRTKLNRYFAEPAVITNHQAVFWFALSVVAAVATAYVYAINRRVPFVTFLTATSTTDLAIARIDSGRGFIGNVYIKNVFSLGMAPFVSYVALGYAVVYKRPYFRVWFWGTVLVATMAVTYAGDKSPIILYLASLYFSRSFLRGPANMKTVIFAGASAFVIMVLAYIVFNGRSLSYELVRGLVSRIFQGQYAGMPLTFALFPNQHPFLEGASFPARFAAFLGLEHVRSGRLLMEVANPAGVAAGTAGVMNSLFVAEAWANFGWAGLLLAPVWVGTLLQSIHNGLLVAPKTPLTVALMTYFMTALPITGGFVDFLWNPMMIIIGLLAITGSLIHASGGTVYLRTRLRFRRTRLA